MFKELQSVIVYLLIKDTFAQVSPLTYGWED